MMIDCKTLMRMNRITVSAVKLTVVVVLMITVVMKMNLLPWGRSDEDDIMKPPSDPLSQTHTHILTHIHYGFLLQY